jgi:two-component system NtrC family sensor kinase
MKKKILIGFSFLVLIFFAGSILAALHITRTTQKLDKLILLHQVEILREDLIIHIQQVQSRIDRYKLRTDREVDALIAQVKEMNRVMDSCVGCHHSPELTQGLLGMRDMAHDYQTAISRLITASRNPEGFATLERRVQDLGQELITMTQGMAFTANIRLQQNTQETLTTIRQVRNVLYVTLLLGGFLAFLTAYSVAKSLDRNLKNLLEATRRVSQGELRSRVDTSEALGSEFKELGEAFNMMTHNLIVSQRQLVQSSKLAAIGELATNIAYEVNNPLTGVLGYAGLLLKADDIPESKKEYLRTIEHETLRAREILKNLLDFSRRKAPLLVKTDIADVVQDTILLIKGQAKLSNIEIISQCPHGLPAVAVDSDEMKQVFVNLINNAFFAMPKGGTLTIQCRSNTDVSGKKIVAVDIIDNGQGMPGELLEKIFDPFFTTRLDGGGTGLGLSISYMIVQNHGGRIEVESTVGTGSTFTVILPAFESVEQ